MTEEKRSLEEQVSELASFIEEKFPDEPSAPEGAIECAMRLLGEYVDLQERVHEELMTKMQLRFG